MRALEDRDLAVEEVDLAQAPVDGLALVGGQLERGQPRRGRRLPNASLIGGRPLSVRISTAWTSFLARVRWRTSCARRARRRRSARVCSSGSQQPCSSPAASSRASVRASRRSVLTFASVIARSSVRVATTTRATCGSSARAIASALPVASSAT